MSFVVILQLLTNVTEETQDDEDSKTNPSQLAPLLCQHLRELSLFECDELWSMSLHAPQLRVLRIETDYEHPPEGFYIDDLLASAPLLEHVELAAAYVSFLPLSEPSPLRTPGLCFPRLHTFKCREHGDRWIELMGPLCPRLEKLNLWEASAEGVALLATQQHPQLRRLGVCAENNDLHFAGVVEGLASLVRSHPGFQRLSLFGYYACDGDEVYQYVVNNATLMEVWHLCECPSLISRTHIYCIYVLYTVSILYITVYTVYIHSLSLPFLIPSSSLGFSWFLALSIFSLSLLS